jgi:hypothetical protein
MLGKRVMAEKALKKINGHGDTHDGLTLNLKISAYDDGGGEVTFNGGGKLSQN